VHAPEKLPPAPVTPEMIVGAYDPKKNSEPPARTYASLDNAYDFFNRELFNDALPRCLITMQRGLGYYGYFSGDRFVNLNDSSDITDEIALNPNHFQKQTVGGVLSTLVHEMAHLWQHHFGKPGRGRYHNKQWASKMVEIGLIPSATGEPGGKQTGDRVSHFVQEGGRFEQACASYLAGDSTVLFQDSRGGERERERERLRKAASKTRYACGCPQIAWAKAGARLICGKCNGRMEICFES
jgi:predicted SprT family Zn-dependent metalloprotease